MIIPAWELDAVDTTLLVLLDVCGGLGEVVLEVLVVLLAVVLVVVAGDEDDGDNKEEDRANISEFDLKSKSVLVSRSFTVVVNIGASDGNMNGVDACVSGARLFKIAMERRKMVDNISDLLFL